MKNISVVFHGAFRFAIIAFAYAGLSQAMAQEPCPESDGDIGECKVLIEINASDGDIGFHFLIDAEEASAIRMDDPNGAKVFEDKAFGPLNEQTMTETFVESAEPLCWPDPDDPDEDVVSLREFLELWAEGTYYIRVDSEGGEKVFGETELTHNLPAAPVIVSVAGTSITWTPGDDLGHCAPLAEEGFGVETVGEVVPDLIPDPSTVPVAAWEVVMEPDVEDGVPIADEVFSVRISGDIVVTSVDVPMAYLMSLGSGTPVKVEVGAIGEDDNATFAEEDGFCVSEVFEVEECDD